MDLPQCQVIVVKTGFEDLQIAYVLSKFLDGESSVLYYLWNQSRYKFTSSPFRGEQMKPLR